MHLELCSFPVRDVVFGRKTFLDGSVLRIDKEEMATVVNAEGFFSEVAVDLAKPGESTRIIHVMDAIQPRCKIAGGEEPYPGILDSTRTAGGGRTHVLEGVSVIQTGARGEIQEGIIEMSGPGREYSVFGSLNNVVLSCTPPADTDAAAFDAASRKSLVRAARYLGETTRSLQPSSTRHVTLAGDVAPDLPAVVYIYYLQSQGPLRDTFLYGERFGEAPPTSLHPNEVLDGAIVSGNYVIACQKNPTYLHANNPVIEELYAGHGKKLRFAGVVVAGECNTPAEKKRSAESAIVLAERLGAWGVIVSQEGGGHADTDMMLCAAAAERRGLACVLLLNELAGTEGDQPPLVDTSPEARHVVSTGNNDEILALPAVERVLGGILLQDKGDPSSELQISLGRLYTATNQLGAYTLRGRGF